MGKTATQLSYELGGSARSVNKLLLSHGFMEQVSPGVYRPTELGEQFATAVSKDNGYGGRAYREWGWLNWDDGVVDALKVSIDANPNGVVQPATEAATAAAPAAEASRQAARTPLTPEQKLAFGIAGVLGALGVAAATPAGRRVFHEKVRPLPGRVRARLSRNVKPSVAPETPTDDNSESDE
jgi:hypothetical protein